MVLPLRKRIPFSLFVSVFVSFAILSVLYRIIMSPIVASISSFVRSYFFARSSLRTSLVTATFMEELRICFPPSRMYAIVQLFGFVTNGSYVFISIVFLPTANQNMLCRHFLKQLKKMYQRDLRSLWILYILRFEICTVNLESISMASVWLK